MPEREPCREKMAHVKTSSLLSVDVLDVFATLYDILLSRGRSSFICRTARPDGKKYPWFWKRYYTVCTHGCSSSPFGKGKTQILWLLIESRDRCSKHAKLNNHLLRSCKNSEKNRKNHDSTKNMQRLIWSRNQWQNTHKSRPREQL
jgi:hypothetical protein